ncbi:YetF domain-containing protein [Hydrocarboniphaga effusa]|uniref:YetF domain-containing protein n=1 Tax=Hydrocarboniphaga effusa TaxID=243629 RepID=UPI0035AF9978
MILIRDGVVVRTALSQSEVSDEELLAHLRQNGVESPEDARLCLLESDGRISVIKKA